MQRTQIGHVLIPMCLFHRNERMDSPLINAIVPLRHLFCTYCSPEGVFLLVEKFSTKKSDDNLAMKTIDLGTAVRPTWLPLVSLALVKYL